MKKILVVILSLALLISCAALAEEDGQSLVMNLIGDYNDTTSQRATMRIVCTDQTDVADVEIIWPDSAEETVVWNFTCPVEEQDGGYIMNYTDCTKTIVRTEDNAAESDSEIVYENGTGMLNCDADNNITWYDDVEDAGRDCVFVYENHEENIFNVEGVQIDANEADLRSALGEPAEEKDFDGGKELVYSDVSLNNVAVETHFYFMDDMVRAMGFVTHNGSSDVANDISMFIDDCGNDIDAEITKDSTKKLGTKYFGITDFDQLTYFSRYAKDGSLMVYLRTSEKDIYLLVLDQYLQ